MDKILIIKLGAMGDVLRTIPIVRAIKESNKESMIVWVTKPESKEILENLPFIEKISTPPGELSEKFDKLYNFDTDEVATSLASSVNAKEKRGFYSDSGFVQAFNLGAEYYLNTIFDDALKKTNKKTYQEMMFEVAETPYSKHPFKISLSDKYKEYAENFIKKHNIKIENLIGIHTGSSSRWPSKAWSENKVIEFIEKIHKKHAVLIFGGPNEIERNKRITNILSSKGIKVYQNNPNNSALEFASLVDRCEKIVCSDSFALHISIFLGKPTIGLFFCTSPDEVESYGILKKVVSPMLYKFFPERMNEYNDELVNSISADEVASLI